MKVSVRIGKPKVSISVGGIALGVDTGVPIVRGGGGGYPVYEGEYVVTPQTDNAVVLATEGTRMIDDVTVLKVPYYETTNESGGYTVIIG